MNGCSIQRNAFAARDGMGGPLVCPKPRRIGHLGVPADPIRPLRWQSCQQADPLHLESRVALLDIFLTEGCSCNFCLPKNLGLGVNPLLNRRGPLEVHGVPV